MSFELQAVAPAPLLEPAPLLAPPPVHIQQIYQPTVVGPNIPTKCCIKTVRMTNGLLVNGFYLLDFTPIEGTTSFRAFRLPNHNRFYPLIQTNLTTPIATQNHHVRLRKPRGQTDHPCRWKYTRECLTYQNEFYPVLTITPAAFLDTDIIKHESSWVPIREEVNNIRLNVAIKSVIEIPCHAILALLRDAAIQGSVCPITTDEIDIANGAVTSCFHIFEKNAIATWLASDKSKKQCPVCKKECKSFTP